MAGFALANLCVTPQGPLRETPRRRSMATLLKILVEKQFVGVQNPNRNNFYTPLISKEEYTEQRIVGLTERFFGGSYPNVISFLVDRKQMSIKELELLLKQLKNKPNE
jgi:BlaI family penicillinase repressor